MGQVIEFFQKLFWVESWPPRWYCGQWSDFHGWLYILSDLAIWAAYFAIPLLLIKFLARKKNVPLPTVFVLFGAFILLCGMTHLMDAVIFWWPAYRLSALIRFFTAVISWATVVALFKYLPIALSLRTSAELEEELVKRKESEQKFKNLLEATPDALVIVNSKGVIELVNRQCENVFGYTKDELLGKPVEILIPMDFRANHEGHRNGFFANPKTRPMGSNLELKGLRKNGDEFPVEISLSPLTTEGNMLVSAAIRDVTERKNAERKLKETYSQLEYKNKELEQFVYVASHDLQEPVRTINSFIGLFKMEYGDNLPKEAKDYLGFIDGAGERAQQLIVDLLDYSRLAQNKNLEQVDIAAIIEEVKNDLTVKIAEKNATINVGKMPIIVGFETGLRLLFQNLISNAIKFTNEDASPVIDISAQKVNGAWQFSVKDNGIGFSDEFKEKIFVIFQRLHAKSKYQGTGIGLAHCKKIVELHNGRIWAKSEPGKGSTFYFTISVNIDEEEA